MFMFGLTGEHLFAAWEWVNTHLAETLIVAGGLVAGAWKWYKDTRHKDVASGASAQLSTTKAEDDRFKILEDRIDRLVSRESKNERRIDALEDQIVKFRRFVRQIKIDDPALYNKHKHELD